MKRIGCRNSIREIFFFPDCDDLNDEHIVMNEKCCTVFPDAKPVPWYFLRTIPDLHNIVSQIRILRESFQRKFDPDTELLWNTLQVIFCPPRESYLVHDSHTFCGLIALSSPRSFITSRRGRVRPALMSAMPSSMASISSALRGSSSKADLARRRTTSS
jgi:hypothetical protein